MGEPEELGEPGGDGGGSLGILRELGESEGACGRWGSLREPGGA